MRNSFGLTSDYMEQVYEVIFYMKYYGGWSFIESYNLPVGLRKWFYEKLSNQMEKEADHIKSQTQKK